MKAVDQNSITELLVKNYIDRNKQLATFISLINSLEKSQFLAIDGAWGSGKTVFVKQLHALCDSDEELLAIPDIEEYEVEILRKTYTSIYYNAWENDYFDDALQSILYNFIAKIDKTSGELMENSQKRALSKIDVAGLIKSISFDAIDLEGVTDNEELTSEIRKVVDRKEKIKLNLQKLIEKSDKRVLFIVDELDRCSPSFAVKILEVLKHYFELDGVTFVIAINTEQLAHTVKKFYGNDFNGYSYLNKFFDFPFSLKKPDAKTFVSSYLRKGPSSHIATKVPIEVVRFLGLELREIESYYASLDLIQQYMDRQGFYDEETIEYLVQDIFVPLALALKIRSGKEYGAFITGKNAEILTQYLKMSPESIRFAENFCKSKVLTTPATDKNTARDAVINYVNDMYKELFNIHGSAYAKEAHESFIDATNIISYYTTIKPKEI